MSPWISLTSLYGTQGIILGTRDKAIGRCDPHLRQLTLSLKLQVTELIHFNSTKRTSKNWDITKSLGQRPQGWIQLLGIWFSFDFYLLSGARSEPSRFILVFRRKSMRPAPPGVPDYSFVHSEKSLGSLLWARHLLWCKVTTVSKTETCPNLKEAVVQWNPGTKFGEIWML